MKCALVMACAGMLLGLGGCAHPLETVSEQHHQERMDAANANLPVSSGAGDMLGKLASTSHDHVKVSQAAQIQQAMSP